jgi:thymidylate kinase
MKAPGKFIVLYGINNLGKSTQAKLLVKRLAEAGKNVEYLKYPIYELPPTGPRINQLLRSHEQSLSEVEFQRLYAQNRIDFQPALEQKLNRGTWLVAEDYTGTGIAWGLAKGAPLEILEQQNSTIRMEDLAIWLDGRRFLEAREDVHLHETNDELMQRCRQSHRELAERYGWKKINANHPIEKVAQDIWQIVKEMLS